MLVSNLVNAQLISQHFSSTAPTGWSSTSSTWILNYDGNATSNYRGVYDATKYSARFPSAATGNSTYLYIPVTFTNKNMYDITFYTKRACNITVLVNETANQVTPLSTETINNASCNSNFNIWYSWTFTYTATYSGSGYIQILINTVYGGPTSVYLDDFGVSEVSTLPIELLYFKGDVYERYNHLTWSTASETNNDYFNIEKTQDGVVFYNIAKINGAGNSSTQNYYEYDDYELKNNITYYRLKQTDYDGKFKYHDMISVDNREKIRIVVRIINLYGVDVDLNTKGVLILIYEDGTAKKIFNE